MDRQERLRRKRELYRLRQVEETPQEREVRLADKTCYHVQSTKLSAQQ